MEKPTEQIPLNQEEAEVDIESQELQVQDLDFWTLSFLREHIDMPERIDFDPDEELEKIKVLRADNDYLTEEEIKNLYSSSLEKAWHGKYLPMIEKVFQTLEKILSYYGPDKYPEIMRLLAQEPINKWPRLAKILS